MQKAIKILTEKLTGIDYAFIGTSNLFFQGFDVKPQDLDILTNDKGIQEISRIFGCNIDDKNVYYETEFGLGGWVVNVISNHNNPLRIDNFQDEIVRISKFGLTLPCMSLKSELDFYTTAGREKDKEKVKLIQEALK